MDRAKLERLASFDGAVRIDASELKELLEELASYEAGPSQEEVDAALGDLMSFPSEGTSWPDLFAALDALGMGYGEWKVNERNNEDNILGLVVVARGDRALEVRRALEQLDEDSR